MRQPPDHANTDRYRYEAIEPDVGVHIFGRAVHLGGRTRWLWVYLSHGLAELGQSELMLACTGGPESVPAEPLEVYRLRLVQARRGLPVRAGEHSRFASEVFSFGASPHVSGLLYTSYRPFHPLESAHAELRSQRPELEEPDYDGILTGIFLVGEELQVLERYGPARLLSRLGQTAGEFPYRPWFEPGRPCFATPSTYQGSLLNQLPRAQVGDNLNVMAEHSVVTAYAQRTAGARFRSLLTGMLQPEIALLTSLAPRAEASLVWSDSEPPCLLSNHAEAENVALSGSFLALRVDAGPCRGEIVEDGFVFSLSHQEWKALSEALQAEQEWDLSTPTKGLGLRLRWEGFVPIMPDEIDMPDPEGLFELEGAEPPPPEWARAPQNGWESWDATGDSLFDS